MPWGVCPQQGTHPQGGEGGRCTADQEKFPLKMASFGGPNAFDAGECAFALQEGRKGPIPCLPIAPTLRGGGGLP